MLKKIIIIKTIKFSSYLIELLIIIINCNNNLYFLFFTIQKYHLCFLVDIYCIKEKF